jgi:hypothetical protein
MNATVSSPLDVIDEEQAQDAYREGLVHAEHAGEWKDQVDGLLIDTQLPFHHPPTPGLVRLVDAPFAMDLVDATSMEVQEW